MAGLGLVSPGIKVREVDLTRGGITGVSDQTGAIAGPFVKGPINDPTLIENEKDLVDTFGEPKETSGQYEYWMSASSYLSYGGVLRVVRTDGQSLNNANSAVDTGAGSSVTSLKIKNTEDYYNSYTSASSWYWAAKNPGTWANDLKVCVIDARADQTLTGVTTGGITVGAAVTQAFGGTNVGGVGTSLTLNGHIKGVVTGIGSSSLDVKIVSQVSTDGTETNADYTPNGVYEFKTTAPLVISGATGAATTTLTVTRSVAGTSAGAIQVDSVLYRYQNITTGTPVVQNAGAAAIGVADTGFTISDTTGINTIGDTTGNIIRIGTEIIGIGETINVGTGFVGFSTRGIDGTSPTSHDNESEVFVLSNVGSATSVSVSQALASDTTLQVRGTGDILIGDLVRVLTVGVGTTGEFLSVTGVSTNNALQPTGKSNWYDSQTLGLENSTVFWRNVAEKPQTSVYASTRKSRFDEIHVVVVDDSGKESGTSGQILEKWTGLSKAEDAKQFNSPIYYKNFVADNSEYVFAGLAPTGTPTGFATGDTAFTAAASGWGQEAAGIVFSGIGASTYSLQGGNDYGGTYTSPTYAATLGDLMEGYDQFTNQREYPVNYLIMGPGLATREETQGKANKLVQIADTRKDCVATISPKKSDVLSGDVPLTNSDTQTDNIIATLDGVNSSSYAVLDSGYKYTFDRFNNKFRYLPCNADVAGMMARTSQNSFPWFSPAGTSRGTVNNAVKLAYNPSQAQRDLLYTKRINPVIASPGQGIILFGDKTALAYTSAFDRINVRRLFITIETAIERAARAQLFEFNDAITRSNFVNIVEPYLRDVQGKRGITDFLVVCDETNNTPDIIDANEFRADIFVKPARSINFIGLTFVATRTGISFEEVVGTV
ncbi:tail sheath protein [Synechococcus phage S-CAM9]|uniref:Tail sheath protein n=1 Tax=Synechococcus phage S-CAM9 TaxID=1883369 RepID=A0A1D8KPX1_9CAUD|nr:tail sheath [Synechococcus phage S-CAM9]AOV60252.1 tail sheath protein [Synechococcus phage S-CAM9]AOV60708.1 tail sheath protein [Synechococcus phage S-CAM9]